MVCQQRLGRGFGVTSRLQNMSFSLWKKYAGSREKKRCLQISAMGLEKVASCKFFCFFSLVFVDCSCRVPCAKLQLETDPSFMMIVIFSTFMMIVIFLLLWWLWFFSLLSWWSWFLSSFYVDPDLYLLICTKSEFKREFVHSSFRWKLWQIFVFARKVVKSCQKLSSNGSRLLAQKH